MTSYPRRVDGLETHQVEDGVMVHDARESWVHYLNPTAVLVLELCNGRRSPAAIATLVGSAFGLPAPPRREVDDVLAQMMDKGLVATRARRRQRGVRPASKLRHFPHCLWINLDREEARKRYMERHLSVHGVPHTRISAYDGSSGDLARYLIHPRNRCDLSNAELGATLSHLKAVRYFLDHVDAEQVVIAEDDVDLSTCRFWNFDWDYVLAHLPYDWDVVQLAVICWPKDLITRIHPRQPQDWSAACYLLSRHHARKLMTLHEQRGKYKIDNGVMPKPLAEQVVYDSGKTYSIPLFLYRLDFRSAIHQDDVEDIHARSRKAIYEWWSTRPAHVARERLFVLGGRIGRDRP